MPVTMTEENMIKISELHKNTAKYVREAQQHPLIIFRYSEPEAVLTDFEKFKELKERISELEEIVDRLQLKKDLERRKEKTKGKITLEELQEKHGL